MGTSRIIRFWRSPGACAVLAIGVSLMAAADTTSTASAKPTTSSHSTTSHSTSHATSSHAKSGATKSHATASTTGHTTSKHTTAHSSRSKKTARSSKKRGQQVIDSDRARQIQEALIREHYMSGEPSGTWDGATQAAMQRYQADQGWQNKTTPDSRALIKLGLGPSNDHLLNPDSAMTTSAMRPRVPDDTDPKAAPKVPIDPNPKPASDSTATPTPNQQPNW